MRVLTNIVLTTLAVSINAAPALVWRKTDTTTTNHISQPAHVSSVISSTFSNDASSLDVFFVVGRDTDGSEALSTLASSGALPNVAAMYESANSIHHQVGSIESAYYLTNVAKEQFEEGNVIDVNLAEFNRKMSGVEIPTITSESTSGEKRKQRRALALDKANVLIVKASRSEAAELDDAVLRAIESSTVSNVILAGQRSNSEVKEERNLATKRKIAGNTARGRRRLEDAGDDGNNNGQDLSGVYYVNMTPNIFAGLLFTFMFIYVTQIGIGCLGAIQGPPDLYVSKYPNIGREA